jgi:signal transduction histidine kinase/DNA-binding LacI/PurR family transcriptional regulator/AraC-like DNA-binding protein/ActR/RegA family two-component response regulator
MDGWQTSTSARSGLSSRRPTIGLLVNQVVSGLNSGYLWSGVLETAHERGANLLGFAGGHLSDPYEFNACSNVLYELIDKERVDGLIVWASSLASYVGPEAIRGFCEDYRPLPMVSIGMALAGIPSIVLDSYQGMREAIIHLVEVHARRRLAFIHGPEGHRDAIERYRAYTDVLREYGLPLIPDLVSPPYGWAEEGGIDAIRVLFDERQVRPDAVVAVNDRLAFGALQALRMRGVHVPDDVALVGFNNEPVCRLVTPPLTTVPLRMYERGRQAAGMLLALIEGEPVPEQVSLSTRLIVRQSCGCLDPAVVQAKASPPFLPPCGGDRGRRDWKALAGTGALPGVSLAAQREHIVRDMEQALEAADGVPQQAALLLDAFLGELAQGGTPGIFLSTLENVLRQVTEVGGNVVAWQRAASEMRRHLLPGLQGDPEALLYAEDLWHQARVVIGERSRRVEAYRGWQANRQADKLHHIGEALTVALDVPGLMDILARELPQLGIACCYLCLYEDPHKPEGWARLVLAYDEAGRVDLEADGTSPAPGPARGGDPTGFGGTQGRPGPRRAGWRFPSRHLVPGELLSPDRQYSLVITPLYFRQEQLGFILLDGTSLRGNVTQVLRDHISSALKGVQILAENVELYHQALEAQKAAQEGRRLAEEANLLKSRFLSMVSHELLTPLVLLVGLSEMMLREEAGNRPPLPGPYRQDVERMHIGAQQLGSLVRDVLDLARSQMGQLKLAQKPLDLGETLKAVALVGEQLAQSKGLGWRAEIPSGLPKVWGDETRLQQVTLNLVTNAVKFTAQGEVALEVEVGGPPLDPPHGGGRKGGEKTVTVSVRDTGLGVPLAEQAVIFDEFRQSERTAARGYGGLGIGLAICRRLMELHEGQIGVRSSGDEEGGSVFYFTLPAIADGVTEVVDHATRSHTVLLLTQHADDGCRLQEYLARQGFAVETFVVGERPNWLPNVLAAPPGAVVLDCQPASEWGWELIQVLKENVATQDIPVLFFSLSQEQDSGTVLALDYLTKPLGTAALAHALQRLGLGDGGCQDRRTILVVDDEPAILEMHARMVQTYLPACRVLTAANGRDALEIIGREQPVLVLLDLLMPELDGFGVLEAMQADERTRTIPVIVLTAQLLTQEDMARLNQGVTAVLEKGLFSTEETLAHIEQTLARNKSLGNDMQRTVRQVMAYIHEHYAEPISREDMAAYGGVSARHLTRCFSQDVGVSPITYLNRYRVKQAKRLLLAQDRSITQIAGDVGFSDSSYFARVFRNEMGVSPRAYQRGDRPASSDPA